MMRETIQKTISAGVWGAVFAVLGAATGIMVGVARAQIRRRGPAEISPEIARERKRDALVEEVRYLGLLRQGLDLVKPQLAEIEYGKRKQLEEMGYLPCEYCGIAHLNGGDGSCLKRGAYWHPELKTYVEPGHPDWSAEGYKTATGTDWSDHPGFDDCPGCAAEAGEDGDDDGSDEGGMGGVH